jgi:hypothetical protein
MFVFAIETCGDVVALTKEQDPVTRQNISQSWRSPENQPSRERCFVHDNGSSFGICASESPLG